MYGISLLVLVLVLDTKNGDWYLKLSHNNKSLSIYLSHTISLSLSLCLYTTQLALSASRASAILEHADDSILLAVQTAQRSYVITDPALPDNPIIFASKGFCELTGYSLENILGRNCRFLQGTY